MTGNIDVRDLDPSMFYGLVDLMEQVDEKAVEELDAILVGLDRFTDSLGDQTRLLENACRRLSFETGLVTQRKSGSKRVFDDAEGRDTQGGPGNFLALILTIINTVREMSAIVASTAHGLEPGKPVLRTRKFTGEIDDFAELQHMVAEFSLNLPLLRRFSTSLVGLDNVRPLLLKAIHHLTDQIEAYHRKLQQRHGKDGMPIHDSPVATDVALAIFLNVDGHGEIEDGRKPDEISAYSIRRAQAMIHGVRSGLASAFIQDPDAFLDFVINNLRSLLDFCNKLESVFEKTLTAGRGILPELRKQSHDVTAPIESALMLLESLDPNQVPYKESTTLLSPEERYRLNFVNQTVLRIVRMLGDETIGDDALIRYILDRKAQLHAYYKDENSFYVCRISNGNTWMGEAPGALEVVPGTRPTVNLDEIFGTGYADLRAHAGTIEATAQWHDLFVATSPSKTADKSNVLMVGPQGCHRKGTKVLLYDGTLRAVEDVKVGDKIMGPDSTPRTVQKLHRGIEEMVEIIPSKGDPWVVNKGHVLTLVRTQYKGGSGYRAANEVKDVTVSDYLGWSKTQKHNHTLFRVGVDFEPGLALPMASYFLGVLLGDGCLRDRVNVTTKDEVIVKEVCAQADQFGLRVSIDGEGKRSAPAYHLSGMRGKTNPITIILRELGLMDCDSGSKFIPHVYKTASRKERLELLAGLIDTDGHLHRGCYDYLSKSRALADDVAFVARSVGLAAYISPCRKKSQNGTEGEYFRVMLSGHTDELPVRIPEKKAGARQQPKDVLRTGFTTRDLPAEEYFGFTLDGDHRYLLGDFTVTHNCGKSEVLRGVGAHRGSVGIFAVGSDFNTCWAGEAQKNPKRLFEAAIKLEKETRKHVHILIDEIDSVLNNDKEMTNHFNLRLEFQLLMDGVVHYPRITIWGATNNIERIPMPMLRRFSKVVICGELDQATRVKTLRHFVEHMPTSSYTDSAWESQAKRLEGATGDVIRKIVDHVWREKMSRFVAEQPEQAEALRRWLSAGEAFTISEFTPKRRAAFHEILRPQVAITPDDLDRSIDLHLDNVAIHSEIETAVRTYENARKFLAKVREARAV